MLRLKFGAAILLQAVLLLTSAPFGVIGLSIDSRIYVQHHLLPTVYDSWLLLKFIPPIPIIERVCGGNVLFQPTVIFFAPGIVVRHVNQVLLVPFVQRST
jgi:hypothetical protein